MKKKSVKKGKRVLYWLPRILAILFIVFISLFALDVFGEGGSAGEMALALFMHLIPSLVLIVLTVVAWKCEKVGGILFILLGIVFTVFFDTYKQLASFLLISLPVFVVGVLFLYNAKSRNA